jgi:hypothetical protein
VAKTEGSPGRARRDYWRYTKNPVCCYTYKHTVEVKLSVYVEHDKRREEILDKALDVFVEEGYKDTTFQKIAERCGITRTILYLYFSNKKEIFSASIKRLMAGWKPGCGRSPVART